MSTAHRRTSSFQSLSSTSPTHRDYPKGMAMVLSYLLTPQPVCSMSMGPPSLKKGYFKRWTWISKAEVIGEVTEQSHIDGPLCNWFSALSFILIDQPFKIFVKKIDRKFIKKEKCPTNAQKKIPQNWTINRYKWLLRFVVIGWEVLALSYTQANFVNQCTNHDLGLNLTD